MVALLLVLIPVLSRFPQERSVVLRVARPATVTELSVEWTDAEDGAVVRSSTWRFESSGAPSALPVTLDVPSGRFRLTGHIVRQGRVARFERELELGSGDGVTTVDLD